MSPTLAGRSDGRFGRGGLLASFLVLSIVLFLLGLGAVLGDRYATQGTRIQIRQSDGAQTLGQIVPPEDRAKVASVYLEPDEALDAMDGFSWEVPSVMTPFVGSAPRPGTHDNARINAMQFRAERELEMPKPPNAYRIILTGGSAAYGSGAPSQDRTIGGCLSQMLNERRSPDLGVTCEVWTMANPAWASTQERIAIENRLSELEPDLILSFSGSNDVHWGRFGRDVLWFRTYKDELYWRLVNLGYASVGLAAMPDVAEARDDMIAPEVVAYRLEKNVRLSAFALLSKNVPYVFLLQPTLPVSRKRLSERERERQPTPPVARYFNDCYREIDRRLRDVRATNFHYADLSGLFDSVTADTPVFLDSFHLGDRGNRLVAEAILAELENTPGLRPGCVAALSDTDAR